MSPKAIGCLTPKPDPFPVRHFVKEGRICSFGAHTQCPFLGPYFRQCLMVIQVCVLGTCREKALVGLCSNIFNSPQMFCPLWGPVQRGEGWHPCLGFVGSTRLKTDLWMVCQGSQLQLNRVLPDRFSRLSRTWLCLSQWQSLNKK